MRATHRHRKADRQPRIRQDSKTISRRSRASLVLLATPPGETRHRNAADGQVHTHKACTKPRVPRRTAGCIAFPHRPQHWGDSTTRPKKNHRLWVPSIVKRETRLCLSSPPRCEKAVKSCYTTLPRNRIPSPSISSLDIIFEKLVRKLKVCLSPVHPVHANTSATAPLISPLEKSTHHVLS